MALFDQRLFCFPTFERTKSRKPIRERRRKESDNHLSAESRGDNEKHDAFHGGANQIDAGGLHQQERANNTEALRHEERKASRARLHTERTTLDFFLQAEGERQETAERAGQE